MSYQCANHGWFHLINPCPQCQSPASASGGASYQGLVGIDLQSWREINQRVQALEAEVKLLKERLGQL